MMTTSKWSSSGVHQQFLLAAVSNDFFFFTFLLFTDRQAAALRQIKLPPTLSPVSLFTLQLQLLFSSATLKKLQQTKKVTQLLKLFCNCSATSVSFFSFERKQQSSQKIRAVTKLFTVTEKRKAHRKQFRSTVLKFFLSITFSPLYLFSEETRHYRK